MVVEDDAGVRSSVVALLELLNYRVTAAPDGAAALAELLDRQLPIDLIVSDVIMPQLDGINLMKALRQAGRQTPVILMTGYTADGERAVLQDGEDHGVVGQAAQQLGARMRRHRGTGTRVILNPLRKDRRLPRIITTIS